MAGVAVAATAAITWLVNSALPHVFTPEGPPVLLNVQTDPLQLQNDAVIRMLLPRSAAPKGDIPNPPSSSCAGFHQWSRQLGGVDRDQTLIRVIAQGNTDAAVVITSITAKIVARSEMADSLPIVCPSAGAANIRTISLDLDSRDKSARYIADDGSVKPFGFDLKKGETEVFNISANTRSSGIKAWELFMKLTIKGEEKTMRITDHGSSFKTAGGPVSAAQNVWDWSALRWSVQSDQ